MAAPVVDPEATDFTRRYVNLADAALGALALTTSDDFFADKSRMLNPEPAIFVPGKYDQNGKWMDGWESRRKRGPGHDWCVVRLARPARLVGVDLDTSHFTGNFPPAAATMAIPRCSARSYGRTFIPQASHCSRWRESRTGLTASPSPSPGSRMHCRKKPLRHRWPGGYSGWLLME